MLDLLCLTPLLESREEVAILVGPNGSGKSNYLRKLAESISEPDNVLIVCNTVYDRFSDLRRISRFSAGQRTSSPEAVIKRCIAETLDKPDSRYYQINNILEYCGYRPRFGLRFHLKFDGIVPRVFGEDTGPGGKEFRTALELLRQRPNDQTLWIDPAEPVLAQAHARDFASVLRSERQMIKHGILKGIEICLETNGGRTIELKRASSGQLSLISSLLFLITRSSERPIVIIDEPENSLHPSWQREYVDKLLAALSYRNAKVIIATHSPLVVTGAITSNPDIVSVYQVRDGEPHPLGDEGKLAPSSGIEELLWKAFEVVTPANHFVSVEILDEISKFERGDVSKDELLALIGKMDRRSFDAKQQAFFEGVRELVNKVETDSAGPTIER